MPDFPVFMQISGGDSEATTGSIVTILDVSESSERVFSIFQLYNFAVVGFENNPGREQPIIDPK